MLRFWLSLSPDAAFDLLLALCYNDAVIAPSTVNLDLLLEGLLRMSSTYLSGIYWIMSITDGTTMVGRSPDVDGSTNLASTEHNGVLELIFACFWLVLSIDL